MEPTRLLLLLCLQLHLLISNGFRHALDATERSGHGSGLASRQTPGERRINLYLDQGTYFSQYPASIWMSGAAPVHAIVQIEGLGGEGPLRVELLRNPGRLRLLFKGIERTQWPMPPAGNILFQRHRFELQTTTRLTNREMFDMYIGHGRAVDALGGRTEILISPGLNENSMDSIAYARRLLWALEHPGVTGITGLSILPRPAQNMIDKHYIGVKFSVREKLSHIAVETLPTVGYETRRYWQYQYPIDGDGLVSVARRTGTFVTAAVTDEELLMPKEANLRSDPVRIDPARVVAEAAAAAATRQPGNGAGGQDLSRPGSAELSPLLEDLRGDLSGLPPVRGGTIASTQPMQEFLRTVSGPAYGRLLGPPCPP
ncbi:MAG: hypothetical protein M1832_006234 [Thelocarpon impressellum]|nr:MAG: hypothetical protein M1832_006234 [Thelocarpon impressellum]